MQSKSWAFEAFCQFHAAEDAKSKEDISTEISRLNQALMLLQRLQKSGKFMTNEMPSVIGELVSSASTRLQRAERVSLLAPVSLLGTHGLISRTMHLSI